MSNRCQKSVKKGFFRNSSLSHFIPFTFAELVNIIYKTISMSTVKENDVVRVHYKGKLSNGQEFDSSFEREPLKVELGKGQLIPGFEKGLLDMEVNQKKTITIKKEEAYGEVNKELFQKVPNANIPETIDPKEGMELVATGQDGSEQKLRVAEVNEDHIIVDANHPLAGHDLEFELELVEIV